MKPEVAAAELRALVDQANDADVQRWGRASERWNAKGEAVMAASLGADSATLVKFRTFAEYGAGRVKDAAALLEAAIYRSS